MTENVLTEDKYGKSALLPMAIKIPFFFFFFFSRIFLLSSLYVRFELIALRHACDELVNSPSNIVVFLSRCDSV
mgnify:CR=1 FL=1